MNWQNFIFKMAQGAPLNLTKQFDTFSISQLSIKLLTIDF